MNLIQAMSNSTSDNRIAFLGGLGASYFFTPAVGAFLEAQFTSRGFKAASLSSTANYLDFPFGLAFNHGRGLFSGNSRSHTRLGGYLALPLSGEYPAGALAAAVKTSSFFGLVIDNETHFPISDHFSLGYTLWVKIPLGSAIQGSIDSKAYEIGLGLVVGFF